MIKRISAESDELPIHRYLTTPEMLEDKRNHCVPIWDDFHDDRDQFAHYIVMPVLRAFRLPPFYAVAEVVSTLR